MIALKESLHSLEHTPLLKQMLFNTRYTLLTMSNFCLVYGTSAFEIKGLFLFSPHLQLLLVSQTPSNLLLNHLDDPFEHLVLLL